MATDSRASMRHTLRILRPSLFTDWPAFLAAGVIAVAAFAGVEYWVRLQTPEAEYEGMRNGFAGAAVIALFLVSLFTRNESYFGEGRTHPISRRQVVLLHILDNFAVCFVWLLPPAVVILLTLGVERTHWELLLRIALFSRVAHALLVLFYVVVRPYSERFATSAWTGLSFFALALVCPYVAHWFGPLPGLPIGGPDNLWLANSYVVAFAIALYWLALIACEFGAVRQKEGPEVRAPESSVRDTDWSVLAGPRRNRYALLWEKYRMAFGLLAILMLLPFISRLLADLITPFVPEDSMLTGLTMALVVFILMLLSLLVFFLIFANLSSVVFLVTANQLLPVKGRESILLVIVALTVLVTACPFTNGPYGYSSKSTLLGFAAFAPIGCLFAPLFSRPRNFLGQDPQVTPLEGSLVFLLFGWVLIGQVLGNELMRQPLSFVAAMALTSGVVSYAVGIWAYNRG